MLPPSASAALAFSIALLAAAAAPVQAPSCSTDTFAIDGTNLSVELCAGQPAKGAAKAAVTETLTAKGQTPYVRDVVLELLPGTETARTIDDAPLAKLGLARSLHLTIALRNGSVRLEHALLVPGAIALK
jgi:hypothetical protein